MSAHCCELYELMKPPKGMKFVSGIGCTYSADEAGLSNMETALGICLNGKTFEDFQNGSCFWLFVQQGNVPEKTHNYIVPYSPDIGCLHAKLFLLQYRSQKDKQTKIRCIVASANLTNADELNVYFYLDSSPDGVDHTFGSRMTDIFASLLAGKAPPKAIQELFLQAKSSAFSPSPACELHLVNSHTLEQMTGEAKDAENVLVISPFLHKEIIKQLLPAKGTLVSRSDELDRMGQKVLQGITCRILRKASDDGSSASPEAPKASGEEPVSSALHAKLYLFEDSKKTIVWLGSANATHAAFWQNTEAMVRYETTTPILDDIRNMFTVYMPSPPVPNKGRREFEEKCLDILSSFSWDERSYRITPVKGYTVTLNGIPGSCWPRGNRCCHTVELHISDGTREKVSYFMVNGEPLTIGPDAMRRKCEDAMFRRWKSCLSGSASQTAPSSAKSKERTQSHSSVPSQTLEDLLLKSLEHKGAAAKLLEQLKDDLIQADERTKEVISRAIEALEAVVDRGEQP
ncbi:hypothetical protein JQM68_10350 [Oscillibacter valericigenes]|uniref:phospholipase D-like domain-containing protein n=1 Tax=Oscillibacter valericigenes TaxID=351091 RepID=UPI001F315313|nr:phospholipase D-like domain-containing protein [Oscillibacter valericigenes]MCF2617594.1 hypothetical protein [Oscillibacter valericigenes]